MKVLMIGGSFDPVHIGHLFVAEEVCREFGYDQVVFVPVAQAPHKESVSQATDEQRLEMLQLAVGDFDNFFVDDCEIVRGGRSYTVETIPEIEQKYRPDGPLGLILGDDLVESFGSWKSHEALAQMVDIIVAHRSFEEKVVLAFPHRYADNFLLPISSSLVRSRIAAGKVYRHIVPDAVFRYIEHNELYRRKDTT